MNENSNPSVAMKLLREEIPGACAARRKGMENATGDFMIFFDSDDSMLPDLIERASNIILSDPTTDLVCWKVRIHQLDNTIKVPTVIPGNPIESHLIHTLLRPQGYMVRRDFLITTGGWNKPVEVWNDLELGLRILLYNPKIKLINEILAEIFAQENSITGKDFSSKEGKWEKTLDEMVKVNDSFSHHDKNKIKKILNYRKAILAAHYYREGNKKSAGKLMQQVVKGLRLKEKLYLKFAYHYTKIGLRGVWKVIRTTYV